MARSSTKVSNCFEVAVKGIKPKEFQKIEAIAEGEDFKTLNVADDYARATKSVLDELRAQRAQALQTLAGLAPDVAQAYAPAAAQPPADDDLDAMFDDILAEEVAKVEPKKAPKVKEPKETPDYLLRQKAQNKRPLDGIQLGNGQFVTMENAVAFAKKYMDYLDWGKPFQFNRVLDIAPVDWDRMVAAMSTQMPPFVRPRAPRTATQAAKSAAKNAASGIANTIDALGALFSTKPGTLGSGPVFNEDTYAAAKPLFTQAAADLKASGQDIREVMQAVIRMVMAKFGGDTVAQMKPYIVKFTQDVRDGRIDIAPTNTENEADNGTGTEESTNGPAMSRASSLFTGMSAPRVTAIVDAIRATWANAPEIVVASSMRDAVIPERVRSYNDEQMSLGATGDPQGFVYGGKVYLIADSLSTPGHVVEVLFHEALGHVGLRGVFGDSLKQVLNQVVLARRAEVRAKAAQYGFAANNEDEMRMAAEEVLAEMAQKYPELGIVQRAIAAIRTWLRTHIPQLQTMKLTDAEIVRNFILPARRFVEQGGGGPKGGVKDVPEFNGDSDGMVAASRETNPEQQALQALSQNDETFQHPKSDKDTVEGIANDVNPAITVRKLTNIPGETRYILTTPDGNTHRMMVRPFNPYANEDAPTMYGFHLDENHEMAGIVTERPGNNPEYAEGKDDVYIDVSLMEPGQYGAQIYSIASNYAHNTGKIFIGDPAGLSDKAMKRRVDNMLSSALKFGTTEHLAPHPRQVTGDASIGVPALEWTYGDHLGNIESLIKLSNQIYGPHNPISFEPVSGRFVDSEGNELDESAIRSIVEDGRFRKNGIGVTTAKRDAILGSLLREGGEAARGTGQHGNGLLEKLLHVRLQHGLSTSKVFYSRGSASPDIRFSRSASLSATANKVVDTLNSHFSHDGTMSWWHKSFGSPYNLAQKSRPFKRVFTSAQDFLNDVSFYANEAADHAAKLLPKLEHWKDIFKSPISAEDNKAIEAPIFEGTLIWARDEAGKAVKIADLEQKYEGLSDEDKAGMLLRKRIVTEAQLKRWKASQLDIYSGAIRNRFEATFLRPGVVWSDAELKSIFNLTPDQADLYRQFHAAVGTSLDNMAKSEMLRYGGKDVADLRDMVLDAPTADDAAILLRDHLLEMAEEDESRSGILSDMANGMVDRADKVNKLKKEGYAPLSRFGQYSVDVVVDGERQYFGLFETMADANQMAAKMREEFGADNVESGTVAQAKFELYKGITPESLELFGNMLGLDSTGDKESDKAFQEYLKLTKNNRSAMKRLIHRQGIAGYSTDTGRVLAAFIYSNARQTAAGLHMGEMTDAVNAIPKGQGQLSDYATRYADYVKNPQEEAQAIRGLMFAQYLGMNVASAAVNLTQPVTVSFPYLSQFAGAKGAAAALGKAMFDQRKGEYEPGLADALKLADEHGVTQPQSVHELQAQARGKATLRPGDGTLKGDAIAMAQNNISKLSLAWGKLFGMAEQINRRTTFIAAFRIATEKGIANPAAFATKAVDETQFINNKGNRARYSRGWLGSTAMTFKSYSINYMELLHRMGTQGGPEGKRAVALAMVMLFLMAGAGGLPFVDDLDDLIDGIAQRMGYNFSTKKAKQEFLEHHIGKAWAQFVDRGLTGIMGIPIDIAMRMGMGNLLPGTGIFMPKSDHWKDVMEVGGVATDLLKRAGDGVGQVLEGRYFDGVVTAAPKSVGNLVQGARMYNKGYYQDAKGAKVIDTTPTEAAFKAIGFQPQSVALVGQSNWINQSAKNLYTLNAQAIRAQWAKGIFENDPDQVKDARERMQSWNEKNPGLRIDPNMPAIIRKVREMRKTKAERIADTAPQAMRAQLRKETAEMRASEH